MWSERKIAARAWRVAAEVTAAVPLPQPCDLDDWVDALETWRSRPLDLVPMTYIPGGPIGVWKAPSLRNTGQLNLTGRPALTAPIGPGDDGLPSGLQVISRHHGERTVYRAGFACEKAFPRCRRPRRDTGRSHTPGMSTSGWYRSRPAPDWRRRESSGEAP